MSRKSTMKKLPSDFYKEFHELRNSYGDQEYGKYDLLPATKALLAKYRMAQDDLETHLALEVIHNADRADQSAVDGFDFGYDAHTALGETQRIKRGAMTLNHHERRMTVINRNKINQDRAWAREVEWLELGMDALRGRSARTKRSDVLPEEGDGRKAAE